MENIQIITVDYKKIKNGILPLIVRLGNIIHNFSFSNQFDPIPTLIEWLESICMAADESTFSFRTKYEFNKFVFKKLESGNAVFTISSNFNLEINEKIDSYKINVVNLVDEFYTTLVAYSSTYLYLNSSSKWRLPETELTQIANHLKISEEDALNKLVKLPFNHIQSLFKNIPNVFSQLTIEEEKRSYLEEFLSIPITPGGTDLCKIKSNIISTWLLENIPNYKTRTNTHNFIDNYE